MKFKLVESIDDRLVEVKAIEWTDEQIRDIIDMCTSQGLSIKNIAAKYNVSHTAIKSLLKRNNIQISFAAKKYPVYLNTISYIGDIDGSKRLSIDIPLEYKPSIKLGDYTISEIHQISINLRKRISNRLRATGSEIFAFYMKLLQKGDREANITQLISDILNIDDDQYEYQALHQVKRFALLSVDDKDLISDTELVEFYSYQKIAESWLINLSSRVSRWEEPTTDSGKYLKELSMQYYIPTAGAEDYKKVIEKYDFSSIIYSLFDRDGNRIDQANYKNKINQIPYEAEFKISSLEDLQKYFRSYGRNRNILYGFLDNKSRIVYIGITQNPFGRGDTYVKNAEENRSIAKALIANLINKLIIFKSYLLQIMMKVLRNFSDS